MEGALQDLFAFIPHLKEWVFPLIESINKLNVDIKVPICLNLMIQLHTEDDTDFAVPDNKTIELFKVATPYEYLQEFLKINLLDDTIRYINSGILEYAVESSITTAVIESLKLDVFPNPFIFFDGEVTLVNGNEIHLGELILKNPKNYPFEPNNYYDLKYNEFTKEIIYAELG